MENTSHRHQITNQKLIYEFDQVTFVCNHRAIYMSLGTLARLQSANPWRHYSLITV
jgi:hypothetical protein